MTISTISKRKILIGFYSAIIIAFLHLANGALEYLGILNEVYDTVNNLIYIVAYNYFFVSILFLLKNILVDYYELQFLSKKLYWIIKLQVIAAVISIFITLGFSKVLYAPLILVAIIGVIIFLMLLSSLLKIEKSEVSTIGYLQNYILATFATLIVILITGLVFDMGLLIRYDIKFNYKFLESTLQAIPFVFLGIFFYKTMKEVHG